MPVVTPPHFAASFYTVIRNPKSKPFSSDLRDAFLYRPWDENDSCHVLCMFAAGKSTSPICDITTPAGGKDKTTTRPSGTAAGECGLKVANNR
jgi:hypothetical protein